MRRCPQCCESFKWPSGFLGKRGDPVNRCKACQARYSGWGKLTLEERAARRAKSGKPIPGAGGARVRWVPASKNAKTGPIPVSTTDRDSCPDACSLKNRGCYAEESNLTRLHWAKVPEEGLRWGEFLQKVRELPEGQLWRHNEAGDLPGVGDAIEPVTLAALVKANVGRRGFTFTHKPVTGDHFVNRSAIRFACADGFAVNLSADSIAHAEELALLGVAPVVVVVPEDWPDGAQKTPRLGLQVVVCPAQTTEEMTCERCRLCAAPGRKSVVAFRAHGLRKALVGQVVREKRA